MRLAILANLLAYAVVVSQPLAYIMVMTSAQRALTAPAFIELRQHINRVMTRRVPVIYGITLAIALLCLIVDVGLMLRENVPINGVIDQWSATDYPADWQDYRGKWFAIFAYRQAALLAGFLSLLVGAVFQ
jgi:hypothetical protein